MQVRILPSGTENFTGDLADTTARIAALDAEIATLLADLEAMTTQLTSEQTLAGLAWSQTAASVNSIRTGQNEASTDEYLSDVSQVQDEHQQAVDTALQQHLSQAQQADQGFEIAVAVADSTWNQAMASAQSDYDSATASAHSQFQSQATAAIAARDSAINAASAAFDQAKAAIDSTLEGIKGSALSTYNAAKSSAESIYDTAYSAAVTAYETAVAAAEQARDSVLAQYDGVTYDAGLIDADTTYQAQIAAAVAVRDTALQSARTASTSTVVSALAAYDATVQAANAAHASAMQAADDAYEAAVAGAVDGYVAQANLAIGVYNSGVASAFAGYQSQVTSAINSRDAALQQAATGHASAVQSAQNEFESEVLAAQNQFRSFLRQQFGDGVTAGAFATSFAGLAETFVTESLQAAGNALRDVRDANLAYSNQYRTKADAYADAVEQLKVTRDAADSEAGADYSEEVQTIVDTLVEALDWSPPGGLSMEEYYTQKAAHDNAAKRAYVLALNDLAIEAMRSQGAAQVADIQAERDAAKTFVDWAADQDFACKLAGLDAQRAQASATDQAGAALVTGLAELEASTETAVQEAYAQMLDAISSAARARDEAFAEADHAHAVASESAYNSFVHATASAYTSYVQATNGLYETLQTMVALAEQNMTAAVATAGQLWAGTAAAANSAQATAIYGAKSALNSATWGALTSLANQSLNADLAYQTDIANARVAAAAQLFNDPGVIAIEQAHADFQIAAGSAYRSKATSIVAAAQVYVGAVSAASTLHRQSVIAAAEAANTLQADAAQTQETARASAAASYSGAIASAEASRDNALADALAARATAEDDAQTAFNNSLADATQQAVSAYAAANDQGNKALSAADVAQFESLKSKASALVQDLTTQAQSATSQLSEAEYQARKSQLEKVRDAIKACMASEVELAVAKATRALEASLELLQIEQNNDSRRADSFFEQITPWTRVVAFPHIDLGPAALAARAYSDDFQSPIHLDADGTLIYPADSAQGALGFAVLTAPLASGHLPEPERYQPRSIDRSNDPDGYSNGVFRFLGDGVVSNFASEERLAMSGGLASDLLLSAEVVTEFTGYADPTPLSDVLSAGTKIVDGRYEEAVIQLSLSAAPGGLGKLADVAQGARRVDGLAPRVNGFVDPHAAKQIADESALAHKNAGDCVDGLNCFVAGTQVVIAEVAASEPAVAIATEEDQSVAVASILVGTGLAAMTVRDRTRNDQRRRPRRRRSPGRRESFRISPVPEARISGTADGRHTSWSMEMLNDFDDDELSDRRRGWSHRLLTCVMVICLGIGAFLGGQAVTKKAGAHASTVAGTAERPAVTYKTRNIEDLRSGDFVLARDEHGSSIASRPIKEVYRRTSHHLRHLTFLDRDGREQTLKTTDEHPFWSVGRKAFIKAGELRVGDTVTSPSGELQSLAATWRVEHPEGVPVFNFQVRDFHTYFVRVPDSTGPPLLVHNANDQYHHIVTHYPNLGRENPDVPIAIKDAQDILDAAGMDIHARGVGENVRRIPNHSGPHPDDYHLYVGDSLRSAVQGLTPGSQEYNEMVAATLNALYYQIRSGDLPLR